MLIKKLCVNSGNIDGFFFIWFSSCISSKTCIFLSTTIILHSTYFTSLIFMRVFIASHTNMQASFTSLEFLILLFIAESSATESSAQHIVGIQ